MASAGEVDRELCLGERRVRLRFAGSALAHAADRRAQAAPGRERRSCPRHDRPVGGEPLTRRRVSRALAGCRPRRPRAPARVGRRSRDRRARGRLGGSHAGRSPCARAPLPRARRLDIALVGAGRAAATGALLGVERAGTPPCPRGSRWRSAAGRAAARGGGRLRQDDGRAGGAQRRDGLPGG